MRRCITEHLLLSSNTYFLHLSLSNNKITLNCSLLIHKIDLLALACVNYNYSHSQIVCIRKTHSLFNKLFTITTDFHSIIITPSTKGTWNSCSASGVVSAVVSYHRYLHKNHHPSTYARTRSSTLEWVATVCYSIGHWCVARKSILMAIDCNQSSRGSWLAAAAVLPRKLSNPL